MSNQEVENLKEEYIRLDRIACGSPLGYISVEDKLNSIESQLKDVGIGIDIERTEDERTVNFVER